MAAGIQANAFATTSTPDSGYINPVIYDSNLRKHQYDAELFRFLGRTDLSQLEVPGTQVNIAIEDGWTANSLTEGTETPVSAWGASQVTVTFKAYGDAKQFTEEELIRAMSDVRLNMLYNASSALGVRRDVSIVTELMTTTTTGYYPNGHNSTNVVVGDVLTAADVRKLVAGMKGDQSGGLANLVLHPNVMHDLTSDSQLIQGQNDERTARDISLNGYITSYAGVRLYESNRIQTATENSITVYKNIALGRNEPFVFMPKRAPVFEFDNEFARARVLTFHYWEEYGTSIVIEDSVRIVTTASSL